MAEVHVALLKRSRPELPMVFADLLSADMTQYGGQRVEGISSLFDGAEATDVIHVGGDTLGPPLNAALEMIDHKPAGEEAVARQRMLAAHFSNSTRSAHLLHKQLFRHPKTFVVNAIGGWPWPDDMPALAGADYVGTRNALPGVHHIPDPVVLLHKVLAQDVLAATKSGALQAVRRVTKGRPYWAVQLSDDFAASNSTDALADQLCSASRREESLAIVLFRAGAIHDSLPALENVQSSMRRTCAPDLPIAVFEELDIFSICAVISEAALLVSTSLHTRIVALNYHVPRVTFSARPEVSKHSFFVQHWDDLYASDDALKARRAGFRVRHVLTGFTTERERATVTPSSASSAAGTMCPRAGTRAAASCPCALPRRRYTQHSMQAGLPTGRRRSQPDSRTLRLCKKPRSRNGCLCCRLASKVSVL